VTWDQGRQDGLKIDIGSWYVQGISNQLNAFIDLIGPAIPSTTNNQQWRHLLTTLPVADLEAEYFGWIFNRKAAPRGHDEMLIQGGDGQRPPEAETPLAKGRVEIWKAEPFTHRTRGNDNDILPETVGKRLVLKLFANPTRFVRHQRVPLESTSLPPDQWDLGIPNFRARERIRRRQVSAESPYSRTEFALDDNDNVLIGPRLLAFARPEAWQMHLRRYFDAIESEAEDEFYRASQHLGIPLARDPLYIPRVVETYFEFEAPNAVRTVQQLRPILESLPNSARTRGFRVEYAECGTVVDSQRILLGFAFGREIRVYAKTNRRIRFEVCHKTDASSVKRLLSSAEGGTRITTSNRDELFGWLNILAHDAARLINDLMTAIENMNGSAALTVGPLDLIGEVYDIVANRHRAKAILAVLVTNGCLRAGREGSDFLPEIRQLRRRGILEKVMDTDFVQGPYTAALDAIRQSEGLPPLAVT
jgi:hypothetical protein